MSTSIEKAIQKQRQATSQPKSRKQPLGKSKEKQSERILEAESPKVNVPPSESYPESEVYPILATLETNGMVTPSLTNNQQAEEYRQIKRPLLSNVDGNRSHVIEHGNVIMVTSSLPGEGKTYTTINLAMSIATERDRSVLVIDCDVVKHSLSTLFGLENHPGLIDLLEGSLPNMWDAIVNTDVPSLKILPAGHTHTYSTELLSSKEMGVIMDDLAERYPDRIIILDSPPLLITSQSVVLTQHAGQILVVVEEGVTHQKAVIESISKLDHNKVIGTVLNKRSKISSVDRYGGYYGSYGD
jgi:protein-tyrosine kinase